MASDLVEGCSGFEWGAGDCYGYASCGGLVAGGGGFDGIVGEGQCWQEGGISMSEKALELIHKAKAKGSKVLDLGNCGIKGPLPDEICELDALEELYLGSDWFDTEPSLWIHHNENRQRSSKEKLNQIEDFPARIGKLKNLRVLNCQNAYMKSAQHLDQLTNLKSLSFSTGTFLRLPRLDQLTNLELFEVYGYEDFWDLSPISSCTNLVRINVRHTAVSNLKPLVWLEKLESLDLTGTEVVDVSPLATLPKLRYLNMSLTPIVSLEPLRNRMLEGLVIELSECRQLTNPPYEIAQQGNESILRYWERENQEASAAIQKTTNWHCKLVIVGNGGVGKSTLLGYLNHGGDAPETKRTEWMEVAEWVPEHEFPSKKTEQQDSRAEFGQARVQVFDFGGQEYYHDTHHLFFSTNAAYLVLWNFEKNRIGRDGEYEGEKVSGSGSGFHYPLEYWLDAIRHLNGVTVSELQIETWLSELDEAERGDQYGDLIASSVTNRMEIFEYFDRQVAKIPSLVVQTHIDRMGINFLDQLSLWREFPWIMDFESVSLNPQKPMRLEILKAKLLELIGKIPILGADFSTTYAWVRDAVQDFPEQAIMSVTAFREWVNETLDKHPQAQGRKMDNLHFGAAEIRDLIGYLGSLGCLLHFRDGVLDDRVFLRPDLLKAMILELLRKMSRKRGFFTEEEAAAALEGLSSTHQLKDVLALLQAFKMAFQIGPVENGLWVAPLYLPEEAPEGINLLLQVFDRPLRRISFKHFIHKSVVLEFFQQHVREIKSQSQDEDGKSYLVWRNGMVLQTPDSKELVLVRFFIGESDRYDGGKQDETRPAHIDIFSFASPPLGKAPAEGVIDRLRKITKAWRVEEEVTTDGHHFVPLAKLTAASAKRDTHFIHVGKTFALEDFAAFVEIPWDRIFVSYAEEDEAFCKAFEKHIWPLQQRDKLIIWSKGQLKAGMQTDEVQQQEMQKANIIVLLVSADYFYDRDIWNVELKTALARAERGECKLAVVVVQACDWKATELAKIHHLNHDRVVGDPGAAQAWVDVVEALRGILKTGKEGSV